MHYAPWLCNSTRPQHTLQMFADHCSPRQTIPWEPLIWDCCNHKGGCTLFKQQSTIAAGISLCFVRVSSRQLAVSSLSKGISSKLIIFTRALVLTGLELTTSRTQSECCIVWPTWLLTTAHHNWICIFSACCHASQNVTGLTLTLQIDMLMF